MTKIPEWFYISSYPMWKIICLHILLFPYPFPSGYTSHLSPPIPPPVLAGCWRKFPRVSPGRRTWRTRILSQFWFHLFLLEFCSEFLPRRNANFGEVSRIFTSLKLEREREKDGRLWGIQLIPTNQRELPKLINKFCTFFKLNCLLKC